MNCIRTRRLPSIMQITVVGDGLEALARDINSLLKQNNRCRRKNGEQRLEYIINYREQPSISSYSTTSPNSFGAAETHNEGGVSSSPSI